jgi:hypothetical protein
MPQNAGPGRLPDERETPMRKHVLLPALVVIAVAAVAQAAADKTWTTSGPAGFAAAKLDGVSVLSTGEARLAPTTEKIDGVEAEFVWDVEVGAGGTAYVGTGGPAAVYAVRAGRARLLHKSDQKHVLSVLPMPDGSVLAATAPDGLVLRISRLGKVTTLADLDFPYVWDMALGPHNGIYCATGPEGRLVRLSRTGEAKELLKVKQKNIVCVAVDDEATVYCGTDTDGLVYRLADDKSSVLFDAEESEIHDLVIGGDGALYACTAQSQSDGGSSRSSSDRSDTSGRSEDEPPPPGAPSAHNSIYRIVPDEGGARLARFQRMFVLSLAARGEDVFAGTGTGGRIVAVVPNGPSRIVTDLHAAHISSMATAPDGDIIVGTANPGSLWRLGLEPRESGTLISKPFDADYLSTWGRVWWTQEAPASRTVRMKLRTGNSGKPDEHWSEWSDWATDPAGGPVGAPRGRYAQFSAELSRRMGADPPALLAVNVSYRQSNRRPVIADLAVDGESLLDGDGGSNGNGSRPSQGSGPSRPSRPQNAPPGRRTITWKAADPNGDRLTARLDYRAVDETEWKEIEIKEKEKPVVAWDTSRVPDGLYLLKLTVSDDLDRPAAETMADERVSRPMTVDNRPPAVGELAAVARGNGSYEIAGVAVDDVSRVVGIEVSRNARDWVSVFAADGIMDSSQEAFTYGTGVLAPGEHVFVFAATDELHNTGSGRLVIVVEPEAG